MIGIEVESNPHSRVEEALAKFRAGNWRAPMFAELVLQDVESVGERATVLDIGCGNGFDDDRDLQDRISKKAGVFIGVEPDGEVTLPDYFDATFACSFEDMPAEKASVDVAYATFVLEHIESPHAFWDHLARTLKPGGVFWGFTIDHRHYFAWISSVLKWLKLKDVYLRMVHGTSKYENYPTFYRCNSPQKLADVTGNFSNVQSWSWNRIGQVDYYVPRILRPLFRLLDKFEIYCRLPGSILIVRAVR